MQFLHYLVLAAHPIVHVNASLNAAATVLLLVGYYFIKHGRVEAHKRTMLTAFAVSAVFLACYLYYHYQVGSVRFTHPGTIRYAYYAILLSHVLLAFTVPFLAIWTIYLGLRATGCCGDSPLIGEVARTKGGSPLFAVGADQLGSAGSRKKGTVPAATYRQRHMRWARWTFPIWLYVSVTGVVVYVMLYHLWPPVGQ